MCLFNLGINRVYILCSHERNQSGEFRSGKFDHYDDVIMGAMASQIISLSIVYSTVYSGVDQSKHQSSASLAFVWGIHRGPVNSPQKWPVTRKMFPFDDVIMKYNEPHKESQRREDREILLQKEWGQTHFEEQPHSVITLRPAGLVNS